MNAAGIKPIAYLAPEIPALSATFVYEEILGLERRGYKIIPISVRRAHPTVEKQAKLEARTHYLYERSSWKLFSSFLGCTISRPLLVTKALGLLLGDIIRSSPLKPASWKLAYQFLAGCRLAAIMEQHDCGHLHIHFAHVPTQIGMYASALSGHPFTFVAHANDIFERALLLKQKAVRAKQLITISEFNKSYLTKQGIPEDRISIVRCGVSFESAEPEPVPGEQDIYRVGTLGRLVEKKGIDTLIRSCALLRDRSIPVKLEICGDGPLGPELEAIAQECEFEDHVEFLGSISHSEVADWLKRQHLFVLACKTDAQGDKDGIPVVLMEAMSQSVPVVSTRVSGVPELVVHGHTGLLAEPDDPEDLAKQMNLLLGSDEERRRLAENALEHVESEFSMKANLDRLEKWFPKKR